MTTAATQAAGRRLRVAAALVFALSVVAATLGIGVRATFAGHVAVDEPQYALTALSLYEDGDLDISDELAERRWQVFFDAELPVQTAVLADGRQVSPHDPLLPVLLAVPMGLGGWAAAKFTLALFAGALAALTLWVAVRRFGLRVWPAAIGVGLAAASAPLAVYGQQLYPELPAALVVTAAVAALTGPPDRRSLALLGVLVTALPWLSVKYAPVALALALVAAVRWWRAGQRRPAGAFAVALAVLGAAYLGLHRLIWGGWTAYASADHFQRSGEFGVVGFDPDYVGRGLRLVGLLVDRGYGLVAWQPAWLLAVPAAAALVALRPRGGATLAAPLAAGWLVATFVALTMHGFWWPGRQLVVVLPLALLLILWWLEQVGGRVRAMAVGLGAAGVLTYGGLLLDGWAREITWVSEFQRVDAPLYQLVRPLLPDYRGDFWLPHLAWIAVFAGLAVLGWRSVRGATPRTGQQALAPLSAPLVRSRTSVTPAVDPPPPVTVPAPPSRGSSP